MELGRSMDDPEMILRALMRVPGLSAAQRIELQRDQVALAEKRAQAQFGDNREYGATLAIDYREQLVSMLLDAGDVQGASAEWRLIPAPTSSRSRWDGDRYRDGVEIRLASRTGSLDALLERYRTQPESAPSAETLRFAAVTLRREHDENGARALLEFLYDREIRSGRLEAANFLGLAEVKLQRGDAAAAIALLNRMALVVEDGFETLPPAADLLGKYGKSAEAADFLRRRIKAVPWDAAAKVQLAGAHALGRRRARAIAGRRGHRFAGRVQTARRSGADGRGPGAGSAGGNGARAFCPRPAVSPDAAAKPYQVEARIEAAGEGSDAGAKLRLWQEALAIAPGDTRVRTGALRAAIAAGRDSLALALEQSRPQPQYRREL